MPTLRRILKYTPTVMLGLLVLAWVTSCFGSFQLYGSFWRGSSFTANASYGSFNILEEERDGPWKLKWFAHYEKAQASRYLGKFQLFRRSEPPRINLVAVPIAVVITFLLPLAVGRFISFRFRLWHYLAYTALVAVVLAYYLRWQE